MSKEVIIVTIKNGGHSTIEAQGFIGTACLAATAPIEAALGKTTASVPTADMRATEATLKVGA